MKKTNLSIFYHLGSALANFNQVSIGMSLIEVLMEVLIADQWLRSFMEETKNMPMKESRASALFLISFIEKIHAEVVAKTGRAFSQGEMQDLSGGKSSFESNFEIEFRRVGIYSVLSKGLYDTTALIDTPEQEFSEEVRPLLPDQMMYDFRQAARCLAFEIPTACGFHILRGTEALMLRYYHVLAGHVYPSDYPKNWKRYIEELVKVKAEKKITARLEEIRGLERNPFTHADVNVTIEEAPMIFKLCTAVIYYMAKELKRLKP